MQWTDEAIVLGGRRFGESGLILDVLTSERGRRSGLVYGGASRKKRGQFEVGNSVNVSWSGRLEDQLGRFNVAECTKARAASLLDSQSALLAITTIASLLRASVDEGDEGGSAVYAPTHLLLETIGDANFWPARYAKGELGLLSALGFGLDLDRCALSGANDGLTHVSPKTGRAVRGSEAEDYVDRLLSLPAFLLDATAPASPADINAALALTGHFLERRLFAAVNKPVPEPRERLVAHLRHPVER